MSAVTLERNWTPILSKDGQYYCSPACGGGTFCKKAWFDQAEAEANDLADRMGDGWEPIIWENLGWHYSVRKGDVTIHPQRRQDGPATSYSAWIEPGLLVGHHNIQFIQSAQTPEDALGFATQEARSFISRLTRTLADLSEDGPAT